MKLIRRRLVAASSVAVLTAAGLGVWHAPIGNAATRERSNLLESVTDDYRDARGFETGEGCTSGQTNQNVSSPVRAGKAAFKHTVQNCGERAELRMSRTKTGSVYWMGWSVNKPAESTGGGIVNQWAAYPSPNRYPCAGVGHHLIASSTGLKFTLHYPGAGGRLTCTKYPLATAADVEGKWVDFVQQAKWTDRGDGFMKLWMRIGGDGGAWKLAIDYRGPTWAGNEGPGPYFKMGAYTGDPGRGGHVVHTDEYRLGDAGATFDDVAPGDSRGAPSGEPGSGTPRPTGDPSPSASADPTTGPGPTGSPTVTPRAPGGFVHPGITLTKAELDVIRSEVRSGARTRAAGWAKLRSDKVSGLGHRPSPRSVVEVDGGANSLGIDSAAALSHALQWYTTGNRAHAEKAVEILDAWSGTLRTVRPGPGEYNLQHRLQAGWFGATLVEAAEIVRYTDAGWDKADVDRFSAMLRTVLWPLVSATAPTCGDNGPGCQFQGRGKPRVSNHEASYGKTQLAIAVFLDDRVKFDAGVARYQEVLRGDIDPATGENNETCRDQGHTQMALGELLQAAEIGHSQGIDLYGAQNDLLALGLEYTGKVLAGVPMPSHCGTQRSRARLFPMWEMGYNHYHNREGKPMDYSGRAVQRNRPEGLWFTGMFAWMTLTHADMSAA